MIRISLLVCALALVGCKSKANEAGKAQGGSGVASGAGSAQGSAASTPPPPPPTGAVPALTWTDSDGELLLSTGKGTTLEGPCGLVGTITPTEISLGAQKEAWGTLVRNGRAFSLPRLDWTITVSDAGLVTHKAGGTETQLGTVTGIKSDADLQWFGALVMGAPMVQHTLALESPDGSYKLAVQGAADFRSWEAKSGETPVAVRRRADPRPVFSDKPAFDPAKVTVLPDAGGAYVISVMRDDDATKAAFPSDGGKLPASSYKITEGADGALAIQIGEGKPRPFAKIVGRQKCRAHDQAIAALIWSYVASKSGHDKALPGAK